MHLSVRLAETCPDRLKEGMPPMWPVVVVELPDSEPTRPGPWIRMTWTELEKHKAKYQAEYNAWLASQQQEQ